MAVRFTGMQSKTLLNLTSAVSELLRQEAVHPDR